MSAAPAGAQEAPSTEEKPSTQAVGADIPPPATSPSALVPELKAVSPTAAEVAKPGAAPGRTVKPETAVAVAGAPFQAGSFLVYPQLGVIRTYDSNLYSSNTSPISDRAWIFSPALWLQSNWAKHALNLHIGGDATRYDTYKAENSDDIRLSAEGRYDFSADANVYGGGRYSQEHEDRESPDTRNGLTPTKYLQRRYYGGFFRQFGSLSVRIAGTAQHLDYRDVDFINAKGEVKTINNDDRDRWQYTGGMRVGYEVSPRLEPYLQLAFDNRRYDFALDDNNLQRNSDGRRYLVGMRWNVPRKVKIDAFLGRMTQDFQDPSFTTQRAPVAGAALQWNVGERTTVSAYLDRTIEETTVTLTLPTNVTLVSSNFINTYASAGIEHRFTDKFSARVSRSLSRAAYDVIGRTDEYHGWVLGLTYRVHKNALLELDLADRTLKSSIPTEDFGRRTAALRLVIPFSH